MCGICGYLDITQQRPAEKQVLVSMADTLIHRGPDSFGYFVQDSLGLGFRRLSLLDLQGGDQPQTNEDGSVVLVCNGEIFNYQELRQDLVRQGHSFRTRTDVEVLIHLYEEHGSAFLNMLNGQFAFALYDSKARRMLLARDPSGICPLFYTVIAGELVFGSEVKAMLQHPRVPRRLDLTGLDQILTFPGLVSPRTMFQEINSLPGGHYILVQDGHLEVREYWDLDYPEQTATPTEQPENYYVEKIRELLTRSIKYRLHADVPVGLYLSGGLDSSLIAMLVGHLQPEPAHSFAIGFQDQAICESDYRACLLTYPYFRHHEIIFDWPEISSRLQRSVYHSECPVKETYNTASLALSESVRRNNIKAILTGEGADELFAGYIGYRFDQFREQAAPSADTNYDWESALENQWRLKVWGDSRVLYEKDLSTYRDVKLAFYAEPLGERFHEFDCLNFDVVNRARLQNRHWLHQRSYLDFKLRLSDHLVGDHGDRMALANSVEARYPFLDKDLIDFAREIPPQLKLREFTEKYILREAAKGLVPSEIINREKFAFHAPGSPYLLKQHIEWINDLLSFERIKRQGYLNPATIERLKAQCQEDGFHLNLPFETDLLMIALTLSVFCETFQMPSLV